MILDTIADYVTSLMNVSANTVLIGRDNINNDNFSNNIFVIDFLTPPQNISNGREFDSATELETFDNMMKASFTVEFYGADSFANVNKFLLMMNTQLNRDLQKQYAMTVFKPKGFNDLKQLVGNKYVERYEVEIIVQYSESLTISTLRIESIPVQQMNDSGNSSNY